MFDAFAIDSRVRVFYNIIRVPTIKLMEMKRFIINCKEQMDITQSTIFENYHLSLRILFLDRKFLKIWI